ncbi:MAG TPA: PIG-L deacetylase family protein [Thermomicrobiales bacterium]|nr:PIG-L deacetylase family protein [Thermomicrobiales bacterium]
MATEQEQELEKRALVIMAHPDDAEFSCAGTVAKWVREGWEVHYLVVTDATGGGSDEATEVGAEARELIANTRKAEQREAGRILGLTGIEFLDYPDGVIEPTITLRHDIVRVIRRIRPSRVVCPSPDRRWDPYTIGRYHPDHLAVGAAALAAVYPASQNPWDFPELLLEGLQPHKVSEVWVVGAPQNNHWVDVSDTVDLKIDALRAHHSQLGEHFDRVEENVRRWLGERGKQHGVCAAEEFHLATNG